MKRRDVLKALGVVHLAAALPWEALAHTGTLSFSPRITFNLTDFTKAYVVVAADVYDSYVRVEYLGSISDGAGNDVDVAAFDAGIHPVGAFSSVRLPIDPANAAFASGFGAVRLTSVSPMGTPQPLPLLAFVTVRQPRTINPVGGAAFKGLRFRLPVTPVRSNRTQQYRIAITPVNADTQIYLNGPYSGSPNMFIVPGQHTFLWDSTIQGVEVNIAGHIDITALNAEIVCSAALFRNGKLFDHIYPAVLT